MRRVSIDGLFFDDVTHREKPRPRIVALAKLRDKTALRVHRQPRLTSRSQRADEEFRNAYEQADFVVADGAPIVWLSKLGGQALKERVAGSDLFWTLGRASAETGVTLFFLGGVPGSADAAKDVLEKRYPGRRSSPRIARRPKRSGRRKSRTASSNA